MVNGFGRPRIPPIGGRLTPAGSGRHPRSSCSIARVQAKITLLDGDRSELSSLYTWLQRDDEFRGRVKSVSAELKPGEMGGVTEALTVVLTGGTAALAGTLTGWLSARRTRISVDFSSGDKVCKVEVDAKNAAVASQLFREALEAGRETSPS
jgi:hypothetical protein